jgi:hypothetical protein
MNVSIYHLIQKDFRLNRGPLLGVLIFLSLVVFILKWTGMGHNNTMLPGLAIIFVIPPIFSNNETVRSNIFSLSLPCSRNRLLAARYIFAWLVMLAIELYFSMMGAVLGRWLPEFSSLNAEYPMTVVQFTLFPLMMLSGLPFVIRFGSDWGYLLGILGQTVIVVGITFGVMWLLPGLNPVDGVRGLLHAISSQESVRAAILIASAVIGMLLASLISYRISARIFEKKDLG